jgi:hypothetical protein
MATKRTRRALDAFLDAQEAFEENRPQRGLISNRARKLRALSELRQKLLLVGIE